MSQQEQNQWITNSISVAAEKVCKKSLSLLKSEKKQIENA